MDDHNHHEQDQETGSQKQKKRRRQSPPLTQETIDAIIDYRKRSNEGTRKIAQRFGRGRRQIRSVLEKAGLVTRPPRKPGAKSKLDLFREAITEKAQAGLTGTRILREIREMGYDGGQSILNDYVRTLPGRQPAARRKVWRRFETQPGAEMQVDWSPYQVPVGDKKLTVHVFAATLGYSRKTFAFGFTSENISCLLEAHTMAFDDFGGVTNKIVYDNMATVVLVRRAGKQGKPIYHPRLLEFAKHYGFDPYLCKVRDPNRKGKDERFFWYLERDFIRGSSFTSMEEFNARLRLWLDVTANRRVHGTTRRVPDEAWREEKPLLVRLPSRHFGAFELETRHVGPDAVISVKGTPYTIPARLAAVARQVQVRLFAEYFEVLDQDGQVVFSRRYVGPQDKGMLQIDKSHYDEYPQAQRRSQTKRMDELLLKRFEPLTELVVGIQTRYTSLAHVHFNKLWALAGRYGDERFLDVALKVQQYRRYNAFAVGRILQKQYPMMDEEPNIALTTSARCTMELGDVDSGSIDDYAYLDEATVGGHDGIEEEN